MCDFGTNDYDKLHELEDMARRTGEQIERAVAELERQRARSEELRTRLTDLEAARFADRLELDMDLERWKDGIAAHVGHDLEEVADRLMGAIEAYGRGEDIRAELFDIHGDVLTVMADLLTMDPEEEEEE